MPYLAYFGAYVLSVFGIAIAIGGCLWALGVK